MCDLQRSVKGLSRCRVQGNGPGFEPRAPGSVCWRSRLDHDHLLSKRADAEYVATVLSAWSSRYIVTDAPAVLLVRWLLGSR